MESYNWIMFPVFDSIYESVDYNPVKTRLSELEAEEEEPTNYKAWKLKIVVG